MLPPGLDFRDAITLRSLPTPGGESGSAEVTTPCGEKIEFLLSAYEYAGYAVTLALTPDTVTYSKPGVAR